MPTRMNRYYNNPEIGAAFSNLASIFAPPDPQDVAAMAVAEKTRAENQRLTDLYTAAQGGAPMDQLDRLGLGAGVWSPNQSWGAVQLGDQTQRRGQDIGASTQRYGIDVGATTQRRGQDISASTALQTNQLDNQRQAITSLFQPLSQGQVRPEVPDEFMQAIGLPGIDQPAQGLAPNLSETQMLGQIMGDMYETDPAAMQNLVRQQQASDIDLVEVMGEGGGSEFALPADAIGKPAFVNPGSAPARKLVTYRTPDGRSGTALFDPVAPQGSSLTDHATGEPLPQGVITGEVTDTAEGLTTGTLSQSQRAVMAIDLAMDTTQRLQNLIQNAPASGGLAGAIRGTIQDAIATGGELGQVAEQLQQETEQTLAEGILDEGAAAMAQRAFDPNIPAREALTIMAATQIAKAQSPDRVSNELINRITRALGEGYLLSNQSRSESGIQAILNDLQSRREVLSSYAGATVPAPRAGTATPSGAEAPRATQAPAAAQPETPPAPAIGEIVEGHEFLGGDPADPKSWRKTY